MDPRIRTLFEDQADLLRRQSESDFARKLGEVIGRANAAGMLRSSRAALEIKRAYVEEYDRFAKEAWARLSRIAMSVGVTSDDEQLGQDCDPP